MTPLPEPEHREVIVVGAGIFGTTIARKLAKDGHDVLVLDSEKIYAGSTPAACLMKPSWLTKLSKTQQAESFATLDELYGLHELNARVMVSGFVKQQPVFWVAPRAILKPGRYEKGDVLSIGQQDFYPLVRLADRVIHCKTLILAAGVWTANLIDVPKLRGQAGVAFTWTTDSMEEGFPRVKPWAPYRQLVAMEIEPGKTWCGDGTAVNEESMTVMREAKCLERCSDFTKKNPEAATRLRGIRPYIKGLTAPCYLKKEELPGVWTVTGGAKNGTASAGWAAYNIAKQLA